MDTTDVNPTPANETKNEAPPAVETPIETVPLAELEKTVKALKELEGKYNLAQEEARKREMKELEKNNEWQKVAEIKEKEAELQKNKYEGLKEAMVRREKYNALMLAATSGGILREAIPDLATVDLKDLKIETNSEGDFSVTGADRMVQKLKTLKPHWFRTSSPNINPATPSATSSSQPSDWENLKKLETEYKKNPTKANESAYRAVLMSFKK